MARQILSIAPVAFCVDAVSAAWPWSSSGANDESPTKVQADVPVPAPIAMTPSIPAAASASPTMSKMDGISEMLQFQGISSLDPRDFQMEMWLSSLLVAYVITCLLGRRRNRALATRWFKANDEVLQDEFAGLGFAEQPFIQDGGNEIKSYATGRRSIDHVWIRLNFSPSHDPLRLMAQVVRSLFDARYDPGNDRIMVEFRLSDIANGNKFCFAVLDRTALRKTRDRWDMSTFTTITEHSGADPRLIVMTESGDIVSNVFKQYLLETFQPGSPYLEDFESLIITDMPPLAPDEKSPTLPEHDQRIILTLRVPSNTSVQSIGRASSHLISEVCNLADVLHLKNHLLPDIAVTKFRKRRAEVLSRLQEQAKKFKLEETKEQKEELAARKRKIEKDRAEAKLASMTKAERVKMLAKQEAANRKQTEQKLAKSKKKQS